MLVILQMNPEKFFDYLEGNLSAAERVKLEERLANEPQLRRELEIAREMHRRSPGSREVLGTADDVEIPPPSGKLGPRLAAAFALLVMVNVLAGIAFIIGSKKSEKPADLQATELAVRQQIEASLSKTAETAMPPPVLDVDEIHLTASQNERETIASHVVTLAVQFGGSAMKAPPDDTGITVLAELPASRADEFRQALTPLAPASFSSPTPRRDNRSPTEKVNIYVRITQETPAPAP